ncbi:PD40 domain-containing protein [Flagellimonas zhangzhouensis]|uniref:WD40-like Beta Propeller Repeat n=1 Tax=Flagellimonas zhangzhouensis TaxID=1073328 RepID=A0A1H2VYI9_9FLAO|nr:PD40 domain-containing protein [Allomuricauda zhangzhouensis]SDQ04845.1 WD40-like Beta Propeller Repeat [Allomuricauda zhangzhouensis]SDW73373.1 WD40-like Beta Propeller Repeat [Allomuricauda zhangzhouensis]
MQNPIRIIPILIKPIFWILLFVSASCDNKKEIEQTPSKEALFFGLKPPGSVPEVFAPNIVSTKFYEYGGTFTPDAKEFYFIRQGGPHRESVMVVIELIGNEWKESVVSKRMGQPFISPDGTKMHLGNSYLERTDSGWSEIKKLDPPLNDIPIMRLSASANGTYYFDSYFKEHPDFPLRYSTMVDGKHQAPQILDKSINTGIKNFNHPFIAPDESYVLWDAVKENGYGSSDIYISFKQANNSWGEAINLGDKLNSNAWEASAFVSPDGKYLFFSRNVGSDNYENVDIFWVDAQIIENLKKNQSKIN